MVRCAGVQVPQFILDHAIQSGIGASCNIICTQPRRISAISVAERVARLALLLVLLNGLTPGGVRMHLSHFLTESVLPCGHGRAHP